MPRVLETVLTGRNLLSPMLASASKDVVAFNSTVAAAQEKAAVGASASAARQEAATAKVAASNVKASTTASVSADQQVRSYTRTAESATASSSVQSRAHAKAAESATLYARAQQTANRSLIASNGLLGTSLTPLTAGLGALGLGLGYAAYRGMSFDATMSQVQAATMATAGTMHELRDAAIEQGAKTKYSSEEAAQGITEMAKAGVSTTDILKGGLAGALNLAAAGGIEVAEAAETGATALSVFQLRGSQMSHVADLLAAGAGKAQGTVGDMSAALNQSALVAHATGLTIEETTATLALFAHHGLIGSDAGTSFRQMLLHLQNPSKEAAATMADLGVNMYDARGQFVGMESLAGQLQTRMAGLTQAERDKAMATIFGSDAVRASNILYTEGAKGVVEWTGKVNDAGYAARQAAINQDNLKGDLEKLGGAFDSLMTTIGSGAQGPLRAIVQAFTEIVNVGGDVIGFWNDLPGPVQVAIVTLGAVAALKGPVSSALQVIAFNAKVASALLGATSVSMGGLKSAGAGLLGFFGGPWGLAITGAAIGLSLLVSWLNKSDEATEGATEAQTGLAEALMQSKGALDANVRSAAAKAAMDEGILDQAKLLHIPLSQVTDAILGQGNALNEVGTKFLQYRDARVWGSEADQKAAAAANEAWQALLGLAGQTEGNIVTAQDLAAATAQTGEAFAVATVLTEEQIKAQEDWLKSVSDILTGFVDPLDVYKGLLDEKTEAERAQAEASAAATEDGSDSWKDYVGDVSVSLDEYAAKLEEKILNQQNWRDNIVKVTGWAGAEVGNILLGMGEEGVDIVAQMADGGSAESRRLAAALVADAHAGGDGASAALKNAMDVQAIIGRDGAKATRSAIAAELGIGVGEVQAIADKYGVALATGINPVLASMGKKVINLHQQAGRTYVGVNEYDVGGYTGPGGKHDPAGVVHRGEIVWSQDDIAAHGGVDRVESMRTARRGYADGGFVTAADVPRPYSTAPFRPPISAGADATMQKGFDEVRAWLTANSEAVMGGNAGAGAVGGAWGSLWQLVKSQIPQARINSTFRAGDPGYHGLGKAIDFGFGSGPGGAGSAGLASINRLLHDQVGKNLAELIYDGIGDDRPDLKNGRPLTYNAGTRAEHRNHVHAAVYDRGGMATSAGLLAKATVEPERVLSPRQTEAFERWMQVAPAAMPGYGMGGGWGIGGLGGQGGGVQVQVDARVFVGNQEITDIARVEATAVVVQAETLRTQRGRYNA